ncbi:MAG: ribosome recycling factor [Clostridium sp.]|uniref:ribosome recycling factor n=1 Tax=Clostridium sp. TaxID=1506 RepID=UPI00290C4204|nr:ribosome recycling factor [Clostridium sp.]MDU7337424.1 ribosome recycling factor [Clostridium sp.]
MQEVLTQAESKMKKTLSVLTNEYTTIRAGRANPAVLDKIMVDYYGTPTAVNQLAAISVSEARLLTIQPWDATSVKAIEKAILSSELGINPQSDGKVIRLMFPQLTEERRRDLTKDIAKMSEEAKVAVRSIRRDAIEKLKTMKKNSEISEDDLKLGEKKTQDLTDKYCKEIDGLFDKKQKEIMEL